MKNNLSNKKTAQPVQGAVPASSKNAAENINAKTKAQELNKAFEGAVRTSQVMAPQQAEKNSTVQASPRQENARSVGEVQVTSSVANSQSQQSNMQQQPVSQPQTVGDGYLQGGVAYDPNTDYQALINEAVAAGNYNQAAIYEQQRNAKIAAQGLGYELTYNYAQWLPGGVNYVENTTTQNPDDLSPLINQLYDAADQQIRTGVNYQTQQAADQLHRALQDAQGAYEDAIASQLIEAKQAQDEQALRNQVNGDRGGIGSAQVDSIYNAGAKNRAYIAYQQRQLATDTARQLADLRAQGKYEEAELLLQNSQQRLAALYEEQVRLQNIEESRKSTLISLGQQYLSVGLMPSDAMLSALGIDTETAQRYIDLYQAQQTASGYYQTYAGDADPRLAGFVQITHPDQLGDAARGIANSLGHGNTGISVDYSADSIASSYASGTITLPEALYLMSAIGLGNGTIEDAMIFLQDLDEYSANPTTGG